VVVVVVVVVVVLIVVVIIKMAILLCSKQLTSSYLENTNVSDEKVIALFCGMAKDRFISL